MTKSEWEDHIYKKLKIQSGNYKPLIFDKNYKEIINELLSFVSTFRNYNFIHGDLRLNSILYDNQKCNFTLINFGKSKFKLSELTNNEYYFDFISLYFDLCKLNNKELTNYLQKEIVKYIPYSEIYTFHQVSNSLNDLIDMYKL
jgi:tRNA A-37 threonylcarbamoyl transferase component Bud32